MGTRSATVSDNALSDIHQGRILSINVKRNLYCRLLRNRVSAQQARERKKSYVQDLEARCQVSDQERIQMEQRLKILERENQMLRQVIKNMQVNMDHDDIAM